jgi:hypothetical protein
MIVVVMREDMMMVIIRDGNDYERNGDAQWQWGSGGKSW